MSNLTDALIAAKLMGGSGGSGGGSGLPEITTTTTTIFAEQSVAFTNYDGIYGSDALNIELSGGASYTVTWDGTDYTCVAVDLGADGIYIGNLSIPSLGADTGEPFLIGYYAGDGAYANTLLTGASHTVGISSSTTNYPDGSILIAIGGEWQKAEGYGYEVEEGGVPTVHKIDSKYLPFLMINVDTDNQTIDCEYLTYKAAVEAGVPIWLCDTANKEYYVLEGGSLSITNPILTGSRWFYDSTQSVGQRLWVSVLSVFMQTNYSSWSVTQVESTTILIPNV